MEFLNIDILWNLIWFLPLFFVIAIIASKRRGKYLASILGKRYTEPAHVNLSKNKRIFRLWVLAAIIVLLTIAAARPFWGYRLLPFSGSGRDILAVIDVSRSMLSKDIQPSRLAHAKLLLKNLIKSTPGDRYGIIAFAGSAFLECPLTIDRTSLYTILNDINVGSIPVGSTNIEKALISAIKAFKAATGGYKAIILITDGDELQGSSSNVINTLQEIKTPLFVVGIGDPSKPGLIQLPSKDGQSEFLRDSKGNLVKSKLNEETLKQLAKATNGIYIRSTAVDPGLNVLEKKISQLIPEKHKDGKMTRPIEKFQIPLLLAVLLIFIWLLVGEVKNGKRQINKKDIKIKSNNKHMKTILLLLSFVFISSNFLQADSNDSLPLPDQLPKISSATTHKTLTDSTVKDTPKKKKTPIEMFNMGLNAHSKGDLKNAEKHYTEAINLACKKGDIRSKAYQNMGVIHHAAARKIITQNPEQSIQILSKAENLYKEAMRRGPSRNEVAINQQILLNDKKKAKEIIKRQKEMKKKKDEARKKVKEALDKQKQTNKQKQDKQKQDKSKEQRDADRKTQHAQKAVQDYKNSAKQNNSQKDMQAAQGASDDITKARKNQLQNESKKAEENLKEALKKLGGDNQQKNNQEQQNNQNDKQKQQEKKQKQKQQMQNKKNQAQQKTQEALDKQQQANKSQGKEKKQKQKESNQKTQEAQKAMDDYQKSAKQNNSQQDKQNAEKAKQNLEKAKQNQQKNNGKKAEEELKKALENLKNKEKNKQNKLPPQPKNQPSQPKQGNKKIDPKQADALLKLMAQDEKSLKKELKKRQKEAYGNTPVDKDW